MTEWYSLDNILKHDTPYYFIFGERSNGKTYAIFRHILKNYIDKGERAVYLRRSDEQIKRNNANRNTMQIREILKNENIKKYTSCVYWQNAWYLCTDKATKHKDGTITHENIKEKEPFCYAYALSTMENGKGGNLNTDETHITTIFFDEAMTRARYLSGEIDLFFNAVSTFRRRRMDVKIFLAANTVNIFCPYFKALNGEFALKMPESTIRENKQKNCTFEHTLDNTDKDKSDPYYNFNNRSLDMITHGKWQMADYPKINISWKREDVLFDCFMLFDHNTLHGEVINKNGNTFVFWYPKKDNLKHPDSDIIYADRPDYRRNWYQSIIYPHDNASKLVMSLFKTGKVFYSDDETGEIIRNFVINNMGGLQERYMNM